ncbi:MAG: DUF3455 domain-containing protein [Sphingopyxis sp.]|nr:DUF3455 domain-containing protein [Sphingopyxis sp.]
MYISQLVTLASAFLLSSDGSTESGQSSQHVAAVLALFGEPDSTFLAAAHAEGAQIYECRRGTGGDLSWTFREPVATLQRGGKTVGIHSRGPRWAFEGGEVLHAKPITSLPPIASSDIPWLLLKVSGHEGEGPLRSARLILRVATQGGALTGSCLQEAKLRSVSYSADYIFVE